MPPVVDVVLAIGLGVVVVAVSTMASHFHAPGARPLDALGYLWLIAGAVPLPWRRRAPATVFAASSVLVFSYYLSNYTGGPSIVLPTVALITLTAKRGGLWGPASAAVVLSVLAVVRIAMGQAADVLGGMGVGLLLWAITSVAIGTAIRARRDSILAIRSEAEETGRRRFEAERLRIAREVHDVVAHSLAMISVQASVGAHVGDRRPEEATAALREIKRVSRSALTDLRSTLSVLRGDEDDAAPSPSLDRLPELVATAESAGLNVEVIGDGGEASGDASALATSTSGLPSHIGAAAYRILQESLTNTVRHASGATTVTIRFARTAGKFDIVVSDDGASPTHDQFHGADAAGSGRGLHGMRERAHAVGGWLVAGPRPSGGFEVSASLPLSGEPG